MTDETAFSPRREMIDDFASAALWGSSYHITEGGLQAIFSAAANSSRSQIAQLHEPSECQHLITGCGQRVDRPSAWPSDFLRPRDSRKLTWTEALRGELRMWYALMRDALSHRRKVFT